MFGDVDRFLRCVLLLRALSRQARLLTRCVLTSWRVAFMEKCIEELDFENVDQMVQIHGTCDCSPTWPFIHD